MQIDLLKRLLPGEVNEYFVRNEVRADGRSLEEHRPYEIARGVLGGSKLSSSVKLGGTHILCALT